MSATVRSVIFVITFTCTFAVVPLGCDQHRHDAIAVTSTDDCRHDLQCWAGAHVYKAAAVCVPLIESRAPRSYRWTKLKIFDRTGWGDEEKGTIRYGGNYIEFATDYGTWFWVYYECTYDPEMDTATVAMRPGRG